MKFEPWNPKKWKPKEILRYVENGKLIVVYEPVKILQKKIDLKL